MNNFDFELPEPIIQVVQSFLTGKEAARTITLSKSWHKAWLTRPNLDLDESDFKKRGFFRKSAKKTIRRYEDSNIKIETFRLRLHWESNVNNELADKLIVKALKLGASHLSFEREDGDSKDFVIAHQVFESENLVGLSVKGRGIDIGVNSNVECYKLESLCLSTTDIENEAVIPNIISSCPLIRNLSLSNLNRKGVSWGKSVPIFLPKMRNLKSLTLHYVELDPLFFGDKFPALKLLTLDYVTFRSEDDIEIQSRSLVRLNLTPTGWTTSMFKLDVPSMKKLVIGASSKIPSVSFKSTSKEWESHVSISIQHRRPLKNEWYPALNELLTALSPSNINLSIGGGCYKSFGYDVGHIQSLHKHGLENLTLNIEYLTSLNCCALFDGLFLVCRPLFITCQCRNQFPDTEYSRARVNGFLSKLLEKGTRGVFSSPENFMYGLHDLKEVYVQSFHDDDVFVADLPWKPLIEVVASEIPLEPKQNIRFQLVWKS